MTPSYSDILQQFADDKTDSMKPHMTYTEANTTNPAIKCTNSVMPGLIPAEHGIFDPHPVPTWIPGPVPDPDPGFAGMTIMGYLVAGLIIRRTCSAQFDLC